MKKMGARLGRWGSCCALLSGCSTWVDLETPRTDVPSLESGGGASGSGSTQIPSAGGAGRGAMNTDPPGVESVGGSTSNEGGNSSRDGGGGAGHEPGLFDPLDPPSPVLIPPGAEAPDVKWSASVLIHGGQLDRVLTGAVDYYFRRDTRPEGSADWISRAPFIWISADGLVMLDRLLPDAYMYDPDFVNADGSIVMGTYASSDTNEQGVFRWTRSDGMSKFGPKGDIVQAVQSWSSEKGDAVLVRAAHGEAPDEVVLWTAQSGYRTISDEPGWPALASIEQFSSDGSTIVGAIVDTAADSERLFRWTSGGVELLGGLPELPNCYAVSQASRDGKVIFGSCASADRARSTRKAFRWTPTDGMTALENDDKSCYMRLVEQVSGDGAVAFGRALCGSEWRLMRWSAGSPSTELPATTVPGLSFQNTFLADSDESGRSLCGSVEKPDPSEGEVPTVAFRWDVDTGFLRLPVPDDENYGQPFAVEPSGRVAVGFSGFVYQSKHAMLWDSTGALDIAAYLTAHGVDLRSRPLFSAADVVIQDDTILVRGRGASDQPSRDWIARIPLVR